MRRSPISQGLISTPGTELLRETGYLFSGCVRRSDVSCQITQCNNGTAAIAKEIHAGPEQLGGGVDPRMFKGGHPVKRQDGELPVLRLLNCPDQTRSSNPQFGPATPVDGMTTAAMPIDSRSLALPTPDRCRRRGVPIAPAARMTWPAKAVSQLPFRVSNSTPCARFPPKRIRCVRVCGKIVRLLRDRMGYRQIAALCRIPSALFMGIGPTPVA